MTIKQRTSYPKERQPTFKPVPTTSRRKPSDMASTKCFDAEYTARAGKTRRPASEDIFTMCPLPRSIMPPSTAPTPNMTPLQFTSTVLSHSSSCKFFMFVKYITPAI